MAAAVLKRLAGGRGGRLQLLTADLAEVLERITFDVGREQSLYPVLIPQLIRLLSAGAHEHIQDELEDRITIHRTAELRTSREDGRYTRPDLTAIVESVYPLSGLWRDVHAFEVKAYWSIGRDSLYEAAAQAALQHCSFSWLVAYIPTPDTTALSPEQLNQAEVAESLMPAIAAEAREMGLGVVIARTATAGGELDAPLAYPRRQVCSPSQLEMLLQALG